MCGLQPHPPRQPSNRIAKQPRTQPLHTHARARTHPCAHRKSGAHTDKTPISTQPQLCLVPVIVSAKTERQGEGSNRVL